MELAHPFRSLTAAIAVLSLVACGGGGGGSSVVPSSGGPSSGGTTSAPTSVTRGTSTASSALNVAGSTLNVNQFGSASGAVVFSLRRAIAAHVRMRELGAQGSPSPSPSASPTTAPTATPGPVCQNGVEYSQTGTGTGTMTETIEFFYDQQCTQPRKLIVMTVTFTATGGSSQGTETLYDQTGAIVDYKNDSMTFTTDPTTNALTELSIEQTVAASPSAPPFSQNGFTCLFGSANALNCGEAHVATIAAPQIDPNDDGGENSASPSPSPSASASPTASASPSAAPSASPTPFEVGFDGTLTGVAASPSPSPTAAPSASPSTAPSSSPSPGPGLAPMDSNWHSGTTQIQLTIAGNGYLGAVGSMSIAAGTPPAWTLTGGTQVSTLSGTATIGIGDDDSIGNANMTLTDQTNGNVITLTSNGDHHLSGTVTNSSGQTIATIQVDDSGNGEIQYSSGAAGRIRDWVVLN